MFNNIFGISKDEKVGVESIIGDCPEGFDIMANDVCKTTLIELYVDHLVNKGCSMNETITAVNDAVNVLIEKYNIGSKSLIDTAKKTIARKFKRVGMKKVMTDKLIDGFKQIDVSFTTKAVRDTMDDTKGREIMGDIYYDRYMKKYLSAFDKDFVEKLSN